MPNENALKKISLLPVTGGGDVGSAHDALSALVAALALQPGINVPYLAMCMKIFTESKSITPGGRLRIVELADLAMEVCKADSEAQD